MSIVTTQFVRKPLFVNAVRITSDNFDEIAEWCQGEVKEGEGSDKKHIKVRVYNPKNARPTKTKAYVGDWLLHTDRGYKVYADKAFIASFEETESNKAKELMAVSEGPGEMVKETA